MTTKLLTQAQAEAVYAAMCCLNSVNMFIGAEVRESGRLVSVREDAMRRIHVEDRLSASELYADQSAFAMAYGLQQG